MPNHIPNNNESSINLILFTNIHQTAVSFEHISVTHSIHCIRYASLTISSMNLGIISHSKTSNFSFELVYVVMWIIEHMNETKNEKIRNKHQKNIGNYQQRGRHFDVGTHTYGPYCVFYSIDSMKLNIWFAKVQCSIEGKLQYNRM